MLAARVNLERLIGLELECVIPIVGRGDSREVQQLLATVLSNHGLPAIVRPYSHEPIPEGYRLAIEHDSSLRGESRYQGISWAHIEVKNSPMKWRELEAAIPLALDITSYLGARVNPSCGFHVHHHLPEVLTRPLVIRNLMHLWWRFHLVIFACVAPSRRNNTYCRRPQAGEATRFDRCRSYEALCRQLQGYERHAGLNLSNLTNRGRLTVEWRLHQGTLEWPKVRGWVLCCQRWIEHAVVRSCHFKPEPAQNSRAALNSLLIATGLKPNSRIYSTVDKELRSAGRFLLRRWRRFNISEI